MASPGHPSEISTAGFGTILVSFFATGFSALSYQVIWQRLSAMSSGSDVVSMTIVVSGFLCGLGLGSLIGAAFADRWNVRKALLVYVFCNLGIGILAASSKFFFYDVLFQRFPVYQFSRGATLAVTYCALLIPTTLMGMSLPTLSRAVVGNVQHAGRLIGYLYAVNTAGAAAGCVAGGWFLVGFMGYTKTLHLGATINVGASLLMALVFWQQAEHKHSRTPDLLKDSRESEVKLAHASLGAEDLFWLQLVILSGFLAVSLQIVWFRVFELVFAARAFTFPFVLGNLLLFDGAGAYVGSRLLPCVRDPLKWFVSLQGLIVGMALFSIWFIYWGFALVPLEALGIGQSILPSNLQPEVIASVLWAAFIDNAPLATLLILPAVIVGPTAFLIGMYFPIVQKAVQTDSRLVAKRAGLIDFGIVLGNTLGALLTGLILLDLLGTAGILRILTLAAVAVLVAMTFVFLSQRATRPGWDVPVILAVLGIGLMFFPPQKAFWTVLHRVDTTRTALTVVGEDRTGAAVVLRRKTGAGHVSTLLVMGQLQGRRIEPFGNFHGFLGILGPLIHPAPKSILVIGLGSGSTAYAAAIHPKTQHVEVVEIAAVEIKVLNSLLDSCDIPPLRSVLRNPAVSVIAEDARRLLLGRGQKYDIVVSDPVRPQVSRSGLLNSVEYFRLVRSRLSTGGLLVQWASTDHVVNSALAAFPYVTLSGKVLVAGGNDFPFSRENLRRRLNDQQFLAYLKGGGYDVQAIERFLDQPVYRWGPRTRPLDDGSGFNTDLFPRDEYSRPPF